MKISVVTLGCPKNIVDSERLAAQLAADDVQFVHDATDADVAIINTCAFIQSAREEAVEAILSAIQLKHEGRIGRIYVAGCLPQRYIGELKKEIPEVDGFFAEQDFQAIGLRLASTLGLSTARRARRRSLQTPDHYAYLKISEGCDNRCAYCTIPIIKGNFRSFAEHEIIAEAQELVAGGVRELIVVAQDTTYYGWDRQQRHGLVSLIRKLSGITGLAWIRLLYAHPAHFTEDMISLFNEIESLCRYVDVPIQHISDKVLKGMGRRVTEKSIRQLIDTLRERVPGMAIRTTLMVGFPGEDESDFLLLKQFVAQTRFERLGVFQYSAEEGTRAFRMRNKVDKRIMEERFDELMQLQYDIALEKNRQWLGQTLPVIFDEYEEESGTSIGRTQWDAPLIDNAVRVNENIAAGSILPIRITRAETYDVWGERNA